MDIFVEIVEMYRNVPPKIGKDHRGWKKSSFRSLKTARFLISQVVESKFRILWEEAEKLPKTIDSKPLHIVPWCQVDEDHNGAIDLLEQLNRGLGSDGTFGKLFCCFSTQFVQLLKCNASILSDGFFLVLLVWHLHLHFVVDAAQWGTNTYCILIGAATQPTINVLKDGFIPHALGSVAFAAQVGERPTPQPKGPKLLCSKASVVCVTMICNSRRQEGHINTLPEHYINLHNMKWILYIIRKRITISYNYMLDSVRGPSQNYLSVDGPGSQVCQMVSTGKPSTGKRHMRTGLHRKDVRRVWEMKTQQEHVGLALFVVKFRFELLAGAVKAFWRAAGAIT